MRGAGANLSVSSLKYHRLYPEYIYTRIRNLQGRYNLRILLTMVDIPNHEDSLRELSKTSLVNNVTLILCWSAAEAARYLELYKSYENAGFAAIRGQQSSSYGDKVIDFVTVPRSLNSRDAVALVANFGSLRNAVNADPEQLGMISGWGSTKIKRWSAALDEPFRVRKVGRRTVQRSTEGAGEGGSSVLEKAVPLSRATRDGVPSSTGASSRGSQASGTPAGVVAGTTPAAGQFQLMGDIDDEDEEAMLAAAIEESRRMSQPGQTQQPARQQQGQPPQEESQAQDSDGLSGGIAAALAKLREGGG